MYAAPNEITAACAVKSKGENDAKAEAVLKGLFLLRGPPYMKSKPTQKEVKIYPNCEERWGKLVYFIDVISASPLTLEFAPLGQRAREAVRRRVK